MIGKKTNSGSKTKLISLYVNLELYGKLCQIAQAEDLPMSRTVARLLARAVEANDK